MMNTSINLKFGQLIYGGCCDVWFFRGRKSYSVVSLCNIKKILNKYWKPFDIPSIKTPT